MRLRLIIAAQIGIILGLIGLTVYQGRQLREAQRQLRRAELPPPELPGTNDRPVRLRLQPLPSVEIRSRVRDLDWRSIESPDYATYIANLRRVGCPEQTIRDIIIADIDALFEERRNALQPPPEDWPFWRHPDEITPSEEELERNRMLATSLAALEQERTQLIARLLGPAAAEAEFDSIRAEELRNPSIQFLPPAKREALAEAMAEWRKAQLAAAAIDDDAESARQLEAAERALRESIASLLTPEELHQYELRASPLAQELRERLRGFSASREEFEELFRLEREHLRERAAIEANADLDPQAAERLEAAAIELESRIAEVLGPERFEDYQRSLDPDYQTLFSLALDHEMPASVANEVWDMRQTVAVQAERIRENPVLTPEQKQLALAAIRDETQAAIVDVLGQPLLEAYRRQGGAWITELTEPDPLPATAPPLTTQAPNRIAPPEQLLPPALSSEPYILDERFLREPPVRNPAP